MSSSDRADTTVMEPRAAWAEELDSTVEELTAELASVRRERDDAQRWAEFLDHELREYREDLGSLEERVEALESEPSLFDRLRELFG